MGIISGAKPQLQEELGLSCNQIEGAVSMLPLGAFVASLCCGIMVDKLGRKNIIVLNAILFTVGALVVSLAPNYGEFSSLICGQFVRRIAKPIVRNIYRMYYVVIFSQPCVIL